jgi:purine-binding chemotaxis protein CheW
MEEKGISAESYFSFMLGNNFFAVPVESVREVLDHQNITPVPNALPYLLGVMNIRGAVVTIADFRVLFGYPVPEKSGDASIVVLEIPRDDGSTTLLGIIADKVDVVSRLKIVPFDTADFGSFAERREFVQKVARRRDKFVLVLNLEKILTSIETEVNGHQSQITESAAAC